MENKIKAFGKELALEILAFSCISAFLFSILKGYSLAFKFMPVFNPKEFWDTISLSIAFLVGVKPDFMTEGEYKLIYSQFITLLQIANGVFTVLLISAYWAAYIKNSSFYNHFGSSRIYSNLFSGLSIVSTTPVLMWAVLLVNPYVLLTFNAETTLGKVIAQSTVIVFPLIVVGFGDGIWNAMFKSYNSMLQRQFSMEYILNLRANNIPVSKILLIENIDLIYENGIGKFTTLISSIIIYEGVMLRDGLGKKFIEAIGLENNGLEEAFICLFLMLFVILFANCILLLLKVWLRK